MTLDKLKKLFQKRQIELSDFVAAAAADKPYDEGDLVTVLMAAGKTPEDFEKAVELKRKRLEAVELLATDGDDSDELARIAGEDAEARGEYQRAVAAASEELGKRLESLQSRSSVIAQRQARIREAKRFLLASADPELTSQENESLVLWRIASEKLRAAEGELASADYAVSHPRPDTNPDLAADHRKRMQQRRDECQAEVNDLSGALETIRAAKLEA